jgi:hypothetical protein
MEPAPEPRLAPFRPTEKSRGRLHPALRDTVRVTLVAAAVLLILGSAASWIEVWLPGIGWFDVSSFEGANAGGITLELGLLLFALTWSERASGSRLAPLALAPFVIGVVSLLDLEVAHTSIQTYLDGLAGSGGHGYILPGFWATVGGGVLATLGGGVRVVRLRHAVHWSIGIGRATAGGMVGGVVGAMVGFAAAVNFGQRITADAIGGASSGVLSMLVLVFGFAGAWIGAAVGSWLAASARRS